MLQVLRPANCQSWSATVLTMGLVHRWPLNEKKVKFPKSAVCVKALLTFSKLSTKSVTLSPLTFSETHPYNLRNADCLLLTGKLSLPGVLNLFHTYIMLTTVKDSLPLMCSDAWNALNPCFWDVALHDLNFLWISKWTITQVTSLKQED